MAILKHGFQGRTDGYLQLTAIMDEGGVLELMQWDTVAPRPEGRNTGLDHIALSVGSREAVDALTARLAGDGFTVDSGPRVTGDGYYESCVLGPEGLRVEITL